MNPITIIHESGEYEAAVSEFESYFDNEPVVGSPEADRFELLGMVLAKYESERFPVPAASPADVLRFVMEQSGRTQGDLADLLGSKSRASEILNGRRDLTVAQIRKLHAEWRIPTDALIGEFADA